MRDHPFRERLLYQLMLALYRSGRQAEALGALQAAKRRFAEELGLEPGPQLRGAVQPEARLRAVHAQAAGVDPTGNGLARGGAEAVRRPGVGGRAA